MTAFQHTVRHRLEEGRRNGREEKKIELYSEAVRPPPPSKGTKKRGGPQHQQIAPHRHMERKRAEKSMENVTGLSATNLLRLL
jgi:hypothetical protein